MLRALVSTSLRQPFLFLALAAALLVIGYRDLRNAPLDVFPEFAPPLVEIQTEAPGLSTVEVESLITVPLETALNGTPNLKTIRSKSVLGLSSVVLIFQDGTDLVEARQLVGERLAVEASRLPAVAKPPSPTTMSRGSNTFPAAHRHQSAWPMSCASAAPKPAAECATPSNWPTAPP